MNLLFFLLFNLFNIISNNNIRKLQDSDDDSLLFNNLFSKFKEEWFNTMSDFISQYVYMIPVPYKKEVDYYEIISQVPCLMRGAFLNEDANSENDVIDFKIISPNNKVIFEASSIGKIFSLNLTEKGVYKLSFNNKVNNKEVYPTLIMNTGQNLVVEKDNLSETEKKFDRIINFLVKNEQENKVNRGFRKKGNESLIKTNKYFFIFSLIETFVLIGVSAWQYYYLKHLFEIKGSL
jgi:hypothetical protein